MFLHLKLPHIVFLCFWLLLASFLSRAYESKLLASLVKIDLEKQPKTIQVWNFVAIITTLNVKMSQ